MQNCTQSTIDDSVIVMKFGGSSVQDAARLAHVASIIVSERNRHSIAKKDTHMFHHPRIAVVLSAMKGVTEQLLAMAELAQSSELQMSSNSQRALSYKKEYDACIARHKDVWSVLSKGADLPSDIVEAFHDLEELLHGIAFVKECTLRTNDLILSFGERLVCMILAHYLQNYYSFEDTRDSHSVQFIDARSCIVTNASHGEASVLFDASYANIRRSLSGCAISIVTGFIGATEDDITTTLGRNGSDYTASLIGAAVNAQCVQIWTDVDGVLSADPRIVDDVFVIPRISYTEAMELSYFGAQVIHPQTVVPTLEKNIPIVIKNTLNPEYSGTIIGQENYKMSREITGIASTTYATMLMIEGVGLSGNFYFLPRIFNVFAHNHIKPLMISQSSSEHSICFVLQEKQSERVVDLFKNEFRTELEQRLIQNISTMRAVSIISIIGVKMRGVKGLSGRIFSAIGSAGINVIAIAQGSNEINISFVVLREHEKHAIRVLHHEFFS